MFQISGGITFPIAVLPVRTENRKRATENGEMPVNQTVFNAHRIQSVFRKTGFATLWTLTHIEQTLHSVVQQNPRERVEIKSLVTQSKNWHYIELSRYNQLCLFTFEDDVAAPDECVKNSLSHAYKRARYTSLARPRAPRAMFPFLIRLILSALALLGIAKISGGAIAISSFTAALLAALILGLVNAFIKPILEFVAQALTLPLSCLTLGLWSLVLSWIINGLMFWFVASFVEGFSVKSFGAALLGALALSLVNALASGLVGGKPRRNRNER